MFYWCLGNFAQTLFLKLISSEIVSQVGKHLFIEVYPNSYICGFVQPQSFIALTNQPFQVSSKEQTNKC